MAELERRIESRLAALHDAANVEDFLRTFANATSFASRGRGGDYAPVFGGAELGSGAAFVQATVVPIDGASLAFGARVRR